MTDLCTSYAINHGDVHGNMTRSVEVLGFPSEWAERESNVLKRRGATGTLWNAASVDHHSPSARGSVVFSRRTHGGASK
jgi:hypothetical protein